MIAKNDPVLYLAQYWMNAEHMRRLTFHKNQHWEKFRAYHSYWLSALYVVVEGYRELGLDKAKVPELRNRARIKTLCDFRNGTFHYQRDHKKQLQFLDAQGSRVSSLKWASRLHEQFRQYFVERLGAPVNWGLPSGIPMSASQR